MKTKVFLSILALGLFVSAFSQKPIMELTFTAEYYGQYVPLDSIFIENLTQGGDTTLYASDTILVLEYVSSIGDNKVTGENSFSVTQNYPNPFKEKTTINLYLKEKEYIKITILDILGRELAQYENTLKRGNHSFTFYSANEKYYLLTVTGKQTSKTIKMLNTSGNPTFGGKCKIVYNNYEDNLIGFKSQNVITNFGFNLGDELRYIGYAKTVNEINGSDVIKDAPQTNEIYFFEITEGIPCPGIPTVTYEGHVYNTVLIGDQCWLKENMNYETDNSWWYDNSSSNGDVYGRLYTWSAALTACPAGWHLPSDNEWTTLTDFLGGTNVAGGKMKEAGTAHWNPPNTGATNSSGFTGLPGGVREFISGSFLSLGYYGFWWSATECSGASAWGRQLYYGHDDVSRNDYYKTDGFSVRCLKD